MNDTLIVMKEAFLSKLLPTVQELQLGAIQKFQPEQYPLNAVAAGVAASAAAVLLYLLGRWLRRLPERISTAEQQVRIEKMRKGAREWLPWLLILSASPFGGILIIAAGFFTLSPLVTGLAVVAAQVLWRASPLL